MRAAGGGPHRGRIRAGRANGPAVAGTPLRPAAEVSRGPDPGTRWDSLGRAGTGPGRAGTGRGGLGPGGDALGRRRVRRCGTVAGTAWVKALGRAGTAWDAAGGAGPGSRVVGPRRDTVAGRPGTGTAEDAAAGRPVGDQAETHADRCAAVGHADRCGPVGPGGGKHQQGRPAEGAGPGDSASVPPPGNAELVPRGRRTPGQRPRGGTTAVPAGGRGRPGQGRPTRPVW